MKIALINLGLDTNYGGSLQRFALYTVLTKMGYDVTYIPYIDTHYAPRGLKRAFSKFKRLLYKYILRKEVLNKNGIPLSIYEKAAEKEAKLQIPIFLEFARKYVKCWNVIYHRLDDIREVESSFDAFVVGSDQVWRTGNPIFFLDFVSPTKKKVAYAVSFGNKGESYNNKLIDKMRKLVRRFDAVSFREEMGLELSKEFKWDYAHHPKLTLDPTLLLKADDYLKTFKLSNKVIDNSLFYYVLDNSESINQFIIHISSSLGLVAHGIDTLMPNLYKTTELRLPSPEQWVESIFKAKFVITDSFHGTMFSIIFNKPFITIQNEERGAFRYYPLLNQLGLSNRLVRKGDLENLVISELAPIDWEIVNNKIEVMRKDSLSFIKQALN